MECLDTGGEPKHWDLCSLHVTPSAWALAELTLLALKYEFLHLFILYLIFIKQRHDLVHLEQAFIPDNPNEHDEELFNMVLLLDAQESTAEDGDPMKPLHVLNFEAKINIPPIVQPPEMELKPLPKQLKFVFLGVSNNLPVIISTTPTHLQEKKLVENLEET